MVIKQSIIIEELLNLLVSSQVITQSQVNDLMAKITDEKIRVEERKLNQLKNDLSEYDF